MINSSSNSSSSNVWDVMMMNVIVI